MPSPNTVSCHLLIIASFLLVSACSKNDTDQDYVAKARDLQSQGKLDSAVIELKNALQKNPKNPEARLRLGEVYAELGMSEAAELELQRAKEYGADAEALKVPLGRALLQQREYARTIREVQLSTKTAPGSVPQLLEIRGRAQLGLGQLDEGCALFDQAIKKYPQYVPSYWGSATCAAARGNLADARVELSKAVKIDDKNSHTWALMGDLERSAKRLPEAQAAYDTALKIKNNDLDAYLGRAAARIDSNDLTAASQDIDAAFKLSKNHPIVNQLRGVVQFKQSKYADAKTSFETVLKAAPNYLPAVLWLGMTNFVQGNNEQAAKQFSQYTRYVANATQVQALLALVQAKLGRAQEAQSMLKTLSTIDVRDPQTLATIAQTHLYFGESDRAAFYLAKAVEQKPDAAQLRVALAETLSQQGDRTQSIEQLQNAIQLDPGMANADTLLIQDLIRDKQYDRAMRAVETLEKKQPKDPTTFNLKGGVYFGMKDTVNARKSFEQALALGGNSIAAAANLAQLDLLDGKPEDARQRFQGILAKDRNNVQAMIGMAGVAEATGRETEYVNWLENAAKASASAVLPRVLLASYYLQKNDVSKALTVAQEAQAVQPNNIQALDILATAQLGAGLTNNSVATYTKLVALVPTNPVVHFQLATAQAASKLIPAAKASLNNALALKPDYLPAEMLLASLELDAGRASEALRIAEQIQKQYPRAADGATLQGNILMAQKQFAPALKAYERAWAINKTGILAIKIHQALSAAGNTKEADARLLAWLNDQPKDVVARAYLGASYAQTGRNKQAIEQLELVLVFDPKNSNALNDLAWLYQQEKDPRALAIAEQALQAKPDSPMIMDTLGWILIEKGDTTRGLQLLQKAVEKAPASTELRYHLAVAFAKSGDNARARRELADLLANNKKFPKRQEAQELLRQL